MDVKLSSNLNNYYSLNTEYLDGEDIIILVWEKYIQ